MRRISRGPSRSKGTGCEPKAGSSTAVLRFRPCSAAQVSRQDAHQRTTSAHHPTLRFVSAVVCALVRSEPYRTVGS